MAPVPSLGFQYHVPPSMSNLAPVPQHWHGAIMPAPVRSIGRHMTVNRRFDSDSPTWSGCKPVHWRHKLCRFNSFIHHTIDFKCFFQSSRIFTEYNSTYKLQFASRYLGTTNKYVHYKMYNKYLLNNRQRYQETLFQMEHSHEVSK